MLKNSIFTKFEAKIDKKDRRLDISCEIDTEELLKIRKKEMERCYHDLNINLLNWMKGDRR